MNFVTLMVLIKFDNNNRICPTQELKIKEPKIEEPKIEEPKIEEPKIEEPKIEEPKIEEPTIECNKSNNYYIIQFFLKNVCFFYKKT